MVKDPYLYPNTDILQNKAGIRSKKELEVMEGDLTSLRLAELAIRKPTGQFDLHELCKMHQHIFQDVYEWAGKIRTINIEKSEPVLGGLSVEYSDRMHIIRDAQNILQAMNQYPWEKGSFDETVKKYGRFMADLWKVHPFR